MALAAQPQPAPPRFTPTAKQSYALRCAFTDGIDEILYGGARGGGKTIFDAAFLVEYATRYPGSRLLVVRRDLVDLRDTTLKEFKAFCSQYYPQLPIRWNMSSPITCWIDVGNRNGPTEIRWGDTKDPDSYRSANLNACVIDEASEVSTDFVLIIKATLGRYVLPDGTRPPAKLIMTTNPGPGYCKDEFPIGTTPGKRTVDLGNGSTITRVFIPALPRDNQHLPPNFEAQLRAQYPDVWVKRWVEGDWDAFEGQVFMEFDDSKHVTKWTIDHEFIRNSGWFTVMSLDWGIRSPAAALLVSIDYDANWVVWGEYYAAGRNYKEAAPYLRELMGGLKCVQIIDNAAMDDTTGTSLGDMFNALGFRFQPCSKRKHGPDGSINFLKSLFQEDRIKITPNCVNLIRELKNARWEPLSATVADRKTEPEKMVDKDDHAIDALFYAFEYWRRRPVDMNKVMASEERQMQAAQAWIETDRRENTLRRRDRPAVDRGGWRI